MIDPRCEVSPLLKGGLVTKGVDGNTTVAAWQYMIHHAPDCECPLMVLMRKADLPEAEDPTP